MICDKTNAIPQSAKLLPVAGKVSTIEQSIAMLLNFCPERVILRISALTIILYLALVILPVEVLMVMVPVPPV